MSSTAKRVNQYRVATSTTIVEQAINAHNVLKLLLRSTSLLFDLFIIAIIELLVTHPVENVAHFVIGILLEPEIAR